MGLVEDVAARLRAQIPSRTVYEHAVPDGTLPTAYIVVRGGITAETSARMTDTTHVGEGLIRVLSVARNSDAHKAARTADAGAAFARDALRDFRPSGGQWPMRLALGSDPYRDESVAETTFVVGLQYGLRTDL